MKNDKKSQGCLLEQLRELIDLANKNGLYDAADYLTDRLDDITTTTTHSCSSSF